MSRLSTIVLEEPNIKVKVREGTKDIHVFTDIFRLNHYFFPKQMDGMTVVDVGAHIGSASLLAATRGAMVYAFEPTLETFTILQKNIKKNKLPIIAKNVGVGVKGKRFLNLNKNSDCNSLHALEDPENFVGHEIIEVITLKEALENIPKIDILKIDCEGAEWEFFQEITSGLHKKIPYFVGEIHPLYKLPNTEEPPMYIKKQLDAYVYSYTHI